MLKILRAARIFNMIHYQAYEFIPVRSRSMKQLLRITATNLLTLAISICSSLTFADSPDAYLSNQPHHKLFSGDVPPGVLGTARAMGRGPVAGYFQPIAFSGPQGTKFSLPQGGVFQTPSPNFMAGILIGSVYRFQITGIPGFEGAELFPTVELLDRTYPPPGLATRFPIPINLDQEDLETALDGQMVTRVIYLEDPETAVPLAEKPTTSRAIDVSYYQDPIEVADRFGRPVAIVRIGSVLPPTTEELTPQFYFGYPAWAPIYQPEPEYAPHQVQQP